ncbi:DUF2911 domain-containing protein [bacterium]|nr:MAG: DUF2911 domain-containing protein [bacterium]
MRNMIMFMLAIALIPSLDAQIAIPRQSPKATVTQTVGITEVSISYCRPAVKGREIWGKLVPYNEVWRTGANENTTFTISDTVKIEGTKLAPGTYGLQTIPNTDEWTIVLSKDAKLWGAFNYKPENDALRFKVKPQSAEIVERMRFSFEDVTDNSAMVTLQWEKLKVVFKIEVETQVFTLAKARSAITWQPTMQAANYCLENNVNLDEAMKWIDISITIQENYWNHRVKAQLLTKFNKQADAVKTMEKALQFAKSMPEPPFNMKQTEDMLAEWKKKK